MKGLAAVCYGLGAVSIGYFLFYAIKIGVTNVFTYFWIAFGGVLLGAGAVLYLCSIKKLHIPVAVWAPVTVICAVGLLVVCLAEGCIIRYSAAQPKSQADYMIILGARVKGTKPTSNLTYRLDVAYDYLEKNGKTKVILSGGKGPGEDITEAQAMKTYLENKGVSGQRMFLEDTSTNTDLNIKNSRKFMDDENKSVIVVTNDFHVYRAVKIAQKQGLKNAQGMGSKTKWYTVPNMYVREAFAVIKYTICGQI